MKTHFQKRATHPLTDLPARFPGLPGRVHHSDWDEKIQSAIQGLQCSELLQGFPYPWEEVDHRLVEGQRLSLAGYGSLMNRSSAARTFSSEALAGSRPIIVFGARRVYDYVMSESSRQRFGGDVAESRCGVLNAYVTHDIRDSLNAVCYEISLEELQSLRIREFGYDLLPVTTLNWSEVDSDAIPRFQTVYILSCRVPVRDGRQMINPVIEPHPDYHDLCKAGCLEISDAFLKAFLQSTWVGNSTMQEQPTA